MNYTRVIIISLVVAFHSFVEAQNAPKKRNKFKEVTTERDEDDGSLIKIKQSPRFQLSSTDNEQENPSRSLGVSREALRERLDSIILLLSRHSDRLVAIETKQNQQTERIDNINYRITKLDIQGEERKGQLSELSTTLRHRLQTTDLELEKIETLLEGVNTNVGAIKEKETETSTKLDQLLLKDGSKGSNSQSGAGLQSIITAVFDVKAKTQNLQTVLDRTAQNVTKVAKLTENFSLLSDSLVTRKDLILNLADLRSEIERPSRACTSYQYAMSGDSKSKKADVPTDCWEVLHKRQKTKSGVYMIRPNDAFRPFFAYCDMETQGGGWTVIQRREDGTVDFARGWTDYKHGFGNLAGEFWIGNEKLHQLTNQQVNELYIVLGDFNQKFAEARYSAFAIGTEEEGYSLKLLGGYDGDAGDSLNYHVGQKWSTFDMDNDAWPDRNCARDHTGAWWYKSCDTSNLNGRYLYGQVPPDHEYTGIYWYEYQGPQYSLWQTTMMIRRGGYVNKNKITTPPVEWSEKNVTTTTPSVTDPTNEYDYE